MAITGVIRPPPEIRAVADKTALFVAKNGRVLESRIINSARGSTPKFAFLHSNSPFHAYYEDKIRFYEGGGDGNADTDEQAAKEIEEKKKKEELKQKEEEEARKKQEEVKKKKEKAQKASALDPVARALLTQRSKINKVREAAEKVAQTEETAAQIIGPTPLPKLAFVNIAAPSHLSSVQIETIKLVAQFTALDGKGGPFFQQLTSREWNNQLFAFIHPRHGHFAYFSALVDGYRAIMSTWTKTDETTDTPVMPVADCAGNTFKCLEVAAYRTEFERNADERRRQQIEADGGNGLSGSARIDWQDFVVVETIDFPVDEVVSMLPPPQQQPPRKPGVAPSKTKADEMVESEDEDGETINVVPDYTPKVVSTQYNAQNSSRTHVIDPITGKSVPLADMSEHMRIQLLDPKWAEEKKKFIDKQKESNLVGGDVIANNISRFAQARGGLFGSSEEELLSDQADSKKRQEEANRIIREQAQQPQSAQVGPSLPLPPLPTNMAMAAPPPPLPSLSRQAFAAPLTSDPSSDALAPPNKRPRVEPPASDSGTLPAQPVAPRTLQIPQQLPPAASQVPPPLDANVEISASEEVSSEPNEMLSEADFAASLPNPTVALSIQIPHDSTNLTWNLNGQVVSLSVDVTSKIRQVKTELKDQLGEMPVNKMQLKIPSSGFLKDAATLAYLNIGPTATLEMVPKTRGGRK